MKKLVLIVVGIISAISQATAADWNFYGSTRVFTFHSKIDNNAFTGGKNGKNYEGKLGGSSRIGAKVKVNNAIKGHFEYGALNGVNLRILSGQWDFGPATLVAGQHYTPLLWLVSAQCWNLSGLNKGDTIMSPYGMIYGHRKTQVGIRRGGLFISAVETNKRLCVSRSGFGVQPQKETSLPALQARYTFKRRNWTGAILGGIQSYDIVSNGREHQVTSHLLGIGARFRFKRAYLNGGGYFGRNAGNLTHVMVNGKFKSSGADGLDGDGWGLAYWDGTSVHDRDVFGGQVAAGYLMSKNIACEVGYGYVNTELETDTMDDDGHAYYLQMRITLAPGVTVTPEIGRVDMNDANGYDATYLGAKWQMDF